MPLAAELELPQLDHTDATLRGERYRVAMAALEGYDGWLAGNPFGFTVLEREAAEFFLRTRSAVFPGLTIAELFGISEGPLYEEIVPQKQQTNKTHKTHSPRRARSSPHAPP